MLDDTRPGHELNIVVVSHSAFLSTLMERHLGLPQGGLRGKRMANCEVRSLVLALG